MITVNSKNILLADDSIFFRTKLSAILTEAGHNVKFASDGRDVLKELQIDPNGIDLLVLDLQMPNIDGFGVMEWMGSNGLREKIPVLAVTGVYERIEVMARLKELGAKGLMTKAFTPEQVIYWVNKLLFPKAEVEVKREEERIPLSVPADFMIGDVAYTGFLLNISEGGVFLHTRIELLAGAMVTIKFSLPGSSRVMEVKGMVKWVTPENTIRSLFGGAGIKFTSIEAKDGEEIKEFIRREAKKICIDEA